MQIIYVVVGTLIGSRIGHIIFYEPEILKTNFFQTILFLGKWIGKSWSCNWNFICMAIYSYQMEKSLGFQIKDRNRKVIIIIK